MLAVYRSEVVRLAERVPDLLATEPPLTALRTWIDQLAGYIRIKRGLGEALTTANHQAATAGTYGPVIDAIATCTRQAKPTAVSARASIPTMCCCSWVRCGVCRLARPAGSKPNASS